MQNKICSVSEILKFTLSLILTSLSANIMLVTDRVVLAKFSINAMNASNLGGTFVETVTFFTISIAQIATVFVGQYNGLKEYNKVAYAPWQMIYLGLISFLFYIPMAIFSEYFCQFPEELKLDGLPYVRILLNFAGFHVISVALSSFFIGCKKTSIIIYTFIFGNILNLFLDIVLVFGIGDILKPMGAKGAAIATVIVELLFIITYGMFFLSVPNREKYNTCDTKPRFDIFWRCIKIGFPHAIAKFFNLLGWLIMTTFFSNTSKNFATLESCIISIWMAFIFIADGAGKALSSLSANLIGLQLLEDIKTLLARYLFFNYIICAIYAVPLVLFPKTVIWILWKVNADIKILIADDIYFAMICLLIILVSDGTFHIIHGVLTSGGDTKFPMYLDTISLWIIAVIPIAIMYYSDNLVSIRLPYALISTASLTNAIVIYRRYTKFKWYRKIVDS